MIPDDVYVRKVIEGDDEVLIVFANKVSNPALMEFCSKCPKF